MSAALRVLLIDDEERVRAALQAEIEEADAPSPGEMEWQVSSQGFADVGTTLVRFRPDMVVLDLMEGQVPSERDAGNRSFEQIRDIWFCPIVVYTAFDQRRTFEEHPQVVQVTKGRGSAAQVLAELRKFVPVARLIRSVHEDFDRRIRAALRDSVHALRGQIGTGDEGPGKSVLERAVRRLVAAQADAGASEGHPRAVGAFRGTASRRTSTHCGPLAEGGCGVEDGRRVPVGPDTVVRPRAPWV